MPQSDGLRSDAIKKILVIKLGAFSDLIQALGPMKAIRKHHPEAHITLLTTEPLRELAEKSGYVDEIWIDRRPQWWQIQAWLDLRKKLNAEAFDRVYDLQNNDRTSLYFRLFSPKPEWVGAASGASHENKSLERTRGSGFNGHVQTLSLSGINDVQVDDLSWIKADISHLNVEDDSVLLVPGIGDGGKEKFWPEQKYPELAKALYERGKKIVIIQKEESEEFQLIAENSGGDVIDLSGKVSALEVPEIARKAFLAIGNDNDFMHMVSPTGCRSLVLFSGEDEPHREAPYGPKVSTIQKKKIADITVDDVLEKLNLN